MIPSILLTTIASSHEVVPFSITVETFIIIILFELLREAGIRMPRPVGQAVNIVGTLIIGEAAIRAGIVSEE